MEAVSYQRLGAENVLNAAIRPRWHGWWCSSTDKAVYPVNAMGISKAMMEKLMVAKARMRGEGETVLCATRLRQRDGLAGSVIPLFIDQMKAGYC